MAERQLRNGFLNIDGRVWVNAAHILAVAESAGGSIIITSHGPELHSPMTPRAVLDAIHEPAGELVMDGQDGPAVSIEVHEDWNADARALLREQDRIRAERWSS